jgi:hypothetical protein
MALEASLVELDWTALKQAAVTLPAMATVGEAFSRDSVDGIAMWTNDMNRR